jgi:hypothetical protein
MTFVDWSAEPATSASSSQLEAFHPGELDHAVNPPVGQANRFNESLLMTSHPEENKTMPSFKNNSRIFLTNAFISQLHKRTNNDYQVNLHTQQYCNVSLKT